MRIAITSDLAFTEQRLAEMAQLLDELSAIRPDVLILAGNLGGGPELIDELLSRLSSLQCAKAAILGNQDLWNRTGLASIDLWSTLIPDLLSHHEYTYLENSNLVIGRVGICGSIAWYDYSGRDPLLKYTIEQYSELKGLVNEDSRFVDWQWSDQDFSNQRQAELADRLELLERDRQIDHVIVVTHFPIFGEGLIRQPADQRWNFGMAYTFNLTMGRAVAPRNKVRHVVSGHIKIGGSWPIKFGSNVIQTHIVGNEGYHSRIVAIDI